jgi:hypothetical protein
MQAKQLFYRRKVVSVIIQTAENKQLEQYLPPRIFNKTFFGVAIVVTAVM